MFEEEAGVDGVPGPLDEEEVSCSPPPPPPPPLPRREADIIETDIRDDMSARQSRAWASSSSSFAACFRCRCRSGRGAGGGTSENGRGWGGGGYIGNECTVEAAHATATKITTNTMPWMGLETHAAPLGVDRGWREPQRNAMNPPQLPPGKKKNPSPTTPRDSRIRRDAKPLQE